MSPSFVVSMSEARLAHCSAPPSDPAKRLFAGERQGPDADDVDVAFDAAVIEEVAKARPSREGVADRLGELGLLADGLELGRNQGSSAWISGRNLLARRASAARPRITASRA